MVSTDDDLLEALSGQEALARLRTELHRCLSQRELEIITLRYGLGGQEPLTQRETAQQFGISRSYVSRIEKKALEKLRRQLE